VWFENPRGQGGSATIVPGAEHISAHGFGENNMFLADIDGDGKMDVVTSSLDLLPEQRTKLRTP